MKETLDEEPTGNGKPLYWGRIATMKRAFVQKVFDKMTKPGLETSK